MKEEEEEVLYDKSQREFLSSLLGAFALAMFTAICFYKLGKLDANESCEAAKKEMFILIETLAEESTDYHQILTLLGIDTYGKTAEDILQLVENHAALETSVNKDLDEYINMCNDVFMLKNTGIVQ
jgi:hypothetical protein